MSDFAGRRVVVTGCASGIGEQLALLLAARGAEVVGLDRRAPSVPLAAFHHVDLADSASIAAAATAAAGDRVDVLFNVAGVSGTLGPEAVVGINFTGTRELTEALLTQMTAGAAVVTTASVAASRYTERRALCDALLATTTRAQAAAWCRANRAAIGTGYAVSKDAIVWYTLRRAVALAERGIRINCVAPGVTETPILQDTRRARGDAFLAAIPMPLGRVAAAREPAAAMAFLGSDDASYLSGQVVWVDGGYGAGVATGRWDDVTGSAGTAPPG